MVIVIAIAIDFRLSFSTLFFIFIHFSIAKNLENFQKKSYFSKLQKKKTNEKSTKCMK
jgi:hypothetical protein